MLPQKYLGKNQEYGVKNFSKILKAITADNGTGFQNVNSIEEQGIQVYFVHLYSFWKSAQNECHNRLIRRYGFKRESIENYIMEQILWLADEIIDLPRRQLGYSTSAVLFEDFLDYVNSVTKEGQLNL